MALEKSERPWGRYEVLQESDTHKVKCIWVEPGRPLSKLVAVHVKNERR